MYIIAEVDVIPYFEAYIKLKNSIYSIAFDTFICYAFYVKK